MQEKRKGSLASAGKGKFQLSGRKWEGDSRI